MSASSSGSIERGGHGAASYYAGSSLTPPTTAANAPPQNVTEEGDEVVSGKYRLIKCLGYGIYGAVFSARCPYAPGPEGPLAIKMALQNRNATCDKVVQGHLYVSNESIRRDIKYLKILHDGSKASEFFIDLLDSYKDSQLGQYCMVMPQMACSLQDAILQTEKRQPYPWEQKTYPCLEIDTKDMRHGMSLKHVRSLARQLLYAAEHMQNKDIVHTDIKPGNILMTSLGGTQIKLCDFGSAATPYRSHDRWQALQYRAPEATVQSAADYPLDMWGIAVVILEALFGGDLFPTIDQEKSTFEQNVDHLLNIISFVGHCYQMMNSWNEVGLALYEYDQEQWKIKAGEKADLFMRSQRTWQEILSPELLKAKQAAEWSPSRRAAMTLDFQRFEKFMKRMLDPNPSTRYTAKDALKDPWICQDEYGEQYERERE